MNISSAHLHLLLNHFPIVGVIFALLLLIYAFFKNSNDIKRASYWAFIIIALLTIPTYISGTQAANIALNLPNVTTTYVHQHEELGEWSLITLEILGVMSLIGLFFNPRAKKTINSLSIIILIIAIIATVLVSWTGLRGGIIRHTEVRGEIPFLMPEPDQDHSETDTHQH